MGSVVRLITLVEVDEAPTDRRMSVSARHEAELDDGRRVLLLDDRGWSASGPPGIWARTTVEEIAFTAWAVVGPDEPFGDHTVASMAADHWAVLAGTLARQGIDADPEVLARLPHDVVLGDRLRRRLGGPQVPVVIRGSSRPL